MLLVNMLVVGWMEPNLMNLHEGINGPRKASKGVRLKDDLEALSVKVVRQVEPIRSNRLQLTSCDVSCTKISL